MIGGHETCAFATILTLVVIPLDDVLLCQGDLLAFYAYVIFQPDHGWDTVGHAYGMQDLTVFVLNRIHLAQYH